MIVMGDKHLARVVPGRTSSGHADRRRHDNKPVFMFGTFGPDVAGCTLVGVRHQSSLATKASGGPMVSAHHTGGSVHATLPTDGNCSFMFGVHPE
jgi:hypothetical protein